MRRSGRRCWAGCTGCGRRLCRRERTDESRVITSVLDTDLRYDVTCNVVWAWRLAGQASTLALCSFLEDDPVPCPLSRVLREDLHGQAAPGQTPSQEARTSSVHVTQKLHNEIPKELKVILACLRPREMPQRWGRWDLSLQPAADGWREPLSDSALRYARAVLGSALVRCVQVRAASRANMYAKHKAFSTA
jgi:hypothetical protein